MPASAPAVAPENHPAEANQRPWSQVERDELIVKHLPLVRAIASRVREGLPVQVELDDLIHNGILGLVDAISKYNPEKNVVFHLYAKHRIRGAILDSLRQLDWASRDLRKRYKSIESLTQKLGQNFGRPPTEAEIATGMGVTLGEFRRMTKELHNAGLTGGQPHRVERPDHTSFIEAAEAPDDRPDELLAQRELRSALDSGIETLPPRYQKVVRMYYDQDRTMKQIGTVLGVNESRVSQIHKAALEKLAAALRTNGFASAEVFLAEA
ncbi:MAG: FliA/WhiG family RNA polymerase sigma factor [Acidobacteria bacterium]|nr:FliA/WhiG family RNA polymerase sigma factor [Acidobacteriota bacterium]